MSRTINEHFSYVKIKLYNRKINKVKKTIINNVIQFRASFSIIPIIDTLISFFFFFPLYLIYLKISKNFNFDQF